MTCYGECVTSKLATFHLMSLFHSILTPIITLALTLTLTQKVNTNRDHNPRHNSAVAVTCLKMKGRDMNCPDQMNCPVAMPNISARYFYV